MRLALYNLLCWILEPLFWFATYVLKIPQFQNRKYNGVLVERRRRFDRCVVFFCSSAGEYEQAAPIIARLQSDMFVHVFFFSKSGVDFVEKRQETVSCSLAPFDRRRDWQRLFKELSPSLTILVRHEWWPNFLDTAHRFGPVLIVNAQVYTSASVLNRWLKTWLVQFFSNIFVLDELSAEWFNKSLRVPPEKIVITGDTKYDRVVERLKRQSITVQNLRSHLDAVFPEKKTRVCCGSVYIEDLRIILPAAQQANRDLVAAPHHLDTETLHAIDELCLNHGWRSVRFSTMTPDQVMDSKTVLIWDIMGRLSELYGACDAAVVGGATHNKVHNVLEPAVYGLPLTFGSLFQNSAEAKLLVEAGICRPFRNPEDLVKIWEEGSRSKEQLVRFIANLTGASDKVVAYIRSPRK